MRRGLPATAVLCLLFAAAASGDDLASKWSLFADSENNYVMTGAVQYRVAPGEARELGARFLVDAVSGASAKVGDDPDNAYVGGFSNRKRSHYSFSQPNWLRERYELTGYGTARWAENDATAGYIFSYESVYQSHTLYASARRQFLLRNSALAAGYHHNFDTVDAADAEREKELGLPGRKDVDGASISWQQVLSRKTQGIAGVAARRETGVLESPERDVLFRRPSGLVVVPERLPDERDRGAAYLRLVRYLWKGGSLHAGYQYDLDDWGLRAHSLRLLAFQRLGGNVVLRERVRYYTQSEIDYVRFVAQSGDEYYTANAALQGFDSWLAGVRLNFLSDAASGRRTRVSGGFDVDTYYQTPRNGIEDGYLAFVLGANVLFEF